VMQRSSGISKKLPYEQGSFGSEDQTLLFNRDGLVEAGIDEDFLLCFGMKYRKNSGVILEMAPGVEQEYLRQIRTINTPGGGLGTAKLLSIGGVVHVAAVVSYIFDRRTQSSTENADQAAKWLQKDYRRIAGRVRKAGGAVLAYTIEVPSRHVLIAGLPAATAKERFPDPEKLGTWFARLFREKQKKSVSGRRVG